MSVCTECQENHSTSLSRAIEWHCKNPCQYCNWSLEFRHENFCPIVLDGEEITVSKRRSGEYLKSNYQEVTGKYDMSTYAFALDYIKGLGLPYLWYIDPIDKGIILTLHKESRHQKVVINSITSLKKWGEGLKDIAV